MKLKTLEISGFKSFADRTKIEFMPGITGVVGPNGSGKSNIIEAIRWVMGEQSAKGLRGDKMSDVIFGGTSQRAPLNRAEVSITFDNTDRYLNSDYSEIRITRALYRNGDSKYQINGTTVRLKDIHELFMDSGLGRESFSIISQGRVESIFSAKPEERRSIIEDVAGVYKYKQNKDKAEKELTGVQDNLNRVQDILYELENRVTPLAEQSAKAQTYLTTKARFDQLDQSRLVLELTDWYTEQADIKAQLSRAEDENETHAESVKTHTDALAAMKQARTEAEEKQQQAQAELLRLTTRAEQLVGEQKLQAERSTNRSNVTRELEAQLAQVEDRLTELRVTAANRQETMTAAADQVTTLEANIATLQASHPRQQLTQVTTDIEQLRATLVETMQLLTTAKNQQQFLAQENERNDAESERLAQRQNQLTLQMTNAEATVATAQTAVAETTATLASAQAEFTRLQQLGKQLEEQSQARRQEWFSKMEEDQRLSTRLQSLSRLSENYEGYFQGVRNLMKAKENFPGIHGVLAELISVASTHQTAIETALGGALQNVVVADEQVGKTAISYLTQHRLGRVTFLPLTTIRKRELQPAQIQTAQGQAGFVGVAADLVKTDSAYRPVVQSLLGTTVIVTNMDEAVPMARALQHRVRIVTLDGQVMNAGGSMTGGASRNQGNGLLSQQSEVESLTAQVATLHTQTEQLERQVRELDDELKATTTAFGEAQDQVLVANEAAQAATAQLQVAEERLAQAQKEKSALTYEFSVSSSGTVDHASLVADNQHDIATLSEQQAAQQAQLTSLLAEQTTLSDKMATVDQELTALQAQLATAQANVQAASVRHEDVVEQIQAEEQRLAAYQQQMTDLTADQGDVQQRLANDLTGTLADKEATEDELTDLATELEELRQEIALAEGELVQAQEAQTEAMTSLSRLSGRQGELRSAIQAGERTLEETYDTSFEYAKSQLSVMPIADIRTELQALKVTLSEIGNVNLTAIDEYVEVKERFDFLTQQQDDLVAARDNLRQTMSEMDEEVETRFKETFDAVAEHFAGIFVKMFGGGQAKLELTDPTDLLTTGVDIKAQPPGKKFQQMSLLSGGEKALTAISLLFAILEVRPVPFAVLDETEAALDEANVDRFSRYLHDVNDRTQFIVITHRKGTMTNADVLYGVTMQEPGVSTMVSVNLMALDEMTSEN